MPSYLVVRDQALRRAVGDLPPEAPPAITLESGIQSDASLQRNGVATETFTYAPFVSAGSIYTTNIGDHVRIVSQEVTPEGIREVITESIDIGLRSPVAISAEPVVIGSELTSAEREMMASQNEAFNAAALQSALDQAAGYYTPPPDSFSSESTPYSSVAPWDSGFVESAPIAPPAATQGVEVLPEGAVEVTSDGAVLVWDGAGWVSGAGIVGDFF